MKIRIIPFCDKMRRWTYIYMYESDYLCIDNGISGNMKI